MLSFFAAPIAAILMVGAEAPAPEWANPVVSRAQNMSLASGAAPERAPRYSCTLIGQDPLACIWDCNGVWVLTDNIDGCAVPPY